MKEIYFIVHVEHPRLGWLEHWARDHFDRVYVRSGVRNNLPSLEEIKPSSPVVVMGGPMGVYDTDTHAWLCQEKQLIKSLLSRSQPMLGCVWGRNFLPIAWGTPLSLVLWEAWSADITLFTGMKSAREGSSMTR